MTVSAHAVLIAAGAVPGIATKKGRRTMTTTVKTKPEALKAIEDVAVATKEQLESIVKASQEQARKNFEQTVSAAKEQVEKASAQVLKGYEDLAAFNKDNVDAVVLSSTIAARGSEELSREVAAFARTNFDASVAVGKALLGAKTFQEVVELQSSYAKSSFESFIAEARKIQELSAKITNDAIAPLNARVNAAAEQFSKPLAI